MFGSACEQVFGCFSGKVATVEKARPLAEEKLPFHVHQEEKDRRKERGAGLRPPDLNGAGGLRSDSQVKEVVAATVHIAVHLAA